MSLRSFYSIFSYFPSFQDLAVILLFTSSFPSLFPSPFLHCACSNSLYFLSSILSNYSNILILSFNCTYTFLFTSSSPLWDHHLHHQIFDPKPKFYCPRFSLLLPCLPRLIFISNCPRFSLNLFSFLCCYPHLFTLLLSTTYFSFIHLIIFNGDLPPSFVINAPSPFTI